MTTLSPDQLRFLDPDNPFFEWTAWDWLKEAGLVGLAFLGVWLWIGWQATRGADTTSLRCKIGWHCWKFIQTPPSPMTISPIEGYRYCQTCRTEQVYHYDSQGGWWQARRQ